MKNKDIKFELCIKNNDSNVLSKKILTIDQIINIDYSEYTLVYKRLYTTLNLPDGTEIYEGDIISSKTHKVTILDNKRVPNSDETNTYIIEWSDNNFVCGWQLRKIKTTNKDNFGIDSISRTSIYVFLKDSKIIGNIYETKK